MSDTDNDQGIPDYVVIRPADSLPEGIMPEGLDGKWFDKRQMTYGGGKTRRLGR